MYVCMYVYLKRWELLEMWILYCYVAGIGLLYYLPRMSNRRFFDYCSSFNTNGKSNCLQNKMFSLFVFLSST